MDVVYDPTTTANTNRIDTQETVSSAELRSQASVPSEIKKRIVSSRRQSNSDLSKNLPETSATNSKNLTKRRKCTTKTKPDDSRSSADTENHVVLNVLPHQTDDITVETSPPVLETAKAPHSIELTNETAILPKVSNNFTPETSPVSNESNCSKSNDETNKGVRECNVLSSRKQLSNVRSTFETPQSSRTHFKHFQKLQDNLPRFHMHSADDMLSVISEESLTSSATHCSISNSDLNQTKTSHDKSAAEQVLPTNTPNQLQDPWVRPSNVNNSTTSISTQNFQANSIVNTSNSQFTVSPERKRTRIRFRSESQDELEDIVETNNRMDWNKTTNQRRTYNENVSRERERNDFDLLSRPSWCDAKFALSRIEQVCCFFGRV